MVYRTLSLEEDTRRFRDFKKSQIFRNASRALTRLEMKNGGLTASEVWTEVEALIIELRATDALDRDIMVSQLFTNLRRKVREIERDGHNVIRDDDEVERTITCIFYCLALCLEATTKDQENNPHNDLLDALVKEIIEMNNPILDDLAKSIKEEGEMFESRAGRELIEEKDPLEIEEEWKCQLETVFKHYADKTWEKIERKHLDAFNELWIILLDDIQVSQTMRLNIPIAGDEHAELGINYNAKCIFNIYGMLYRRGFFDHSIKGPTPLAKFVTEHYDCETNNTKIAKYEYFKCEDHGITDQFHGMTSDVEMHVIEIIDNLNKKYS